MGSMVHSNTAGFGSCMLLLLGTWRGKRAGRLGCGQAQGAEGNRAPEMTSGGVEPHSLKDESHTCQSRECFSLGEEYTEPIKHPPELQSRWTRRTGTSCLWWLMANLLTFQPVPVRRVPVLACWAVAIRNAMQSQFGWQLLSVLWSHAVCGCTETDVNSAEVELQSH